MMYPLLTRFIPSVILSFPVMACAQTSTSENVVFLLYGLIGLFGAASVVVFLWGFILYLVRIGTERREDGIHIMEWSISLIITVIILIGLLRYIQS